MALDAHGWLSVPALLTRLKAKDRAWSHEGLVKLETGAVFYLSSNGVWLTEHVPSAFISG